SRRRRRWRSPPTRRRSATPWRSSTSNRGRRRARWRRGGSSTTSAAAAWAPRPSSCSGRTASRSPSCRWSTPPRNPSGTAPSSGVMSVSDLAQYVVTGLLVGGVYALMSIGLALIFGVMRVVNFAQGDFMMLGMYLTYFLAVVSGVDPLLGALLTIPPFFLVGVVYGFLTRTDLGKALRAAADDPEAAGYQGIDVRAMHGLAFGVGIALVAAAGGLLATYHPIEPTVAVNFIVLMFVAVVLGGLGSIPGAFAGGLVIGIVQSLTLLVLPFQLQNVGVFIAFLLVLYLRDR